MSTNFYPQTTDNSHPSIDLESDREQIEQFVEAIFHNAKMDGFVSLRGFYQEETKPFRITPINLGRPGRLGADMSLDAVTTRLLVEAATKEATLAAQEPRAVNFCPPLALFSNRKRAREVDLLQGLAISVEADSRPNSARETLEAILGQATVVVESGGIWTNGNDENENKLHLHWRLAAPAADKDALAKLKQARTLACKIVGGDPTNNTIVHPIRWPGSWHRKSEPRLAKIIAINAEREIDLDIALARLMEKVPEGEERQPCQSGPAQTDPALAAIAIENIANDWEDEGESWYGWNRIGMAIYRATAGEEAGRKIFHTFSKKSKQGRYNEGKTDKKWDGYHISPPTQIGAGTLFQLAWENNPDWRDEFDRAVEARFSGDQSDNVETKNAEPPTEESKPDAAKPATAETKTAKTATTLNPVDLWAKFDPPTLPRGLLPKVIEDFAIEEGELIGADPSGIAMAALAVCAAAIPDHVKLKPKKHDYWTESARIWVALIGPPSTKKTPIISRAARPLIRIDSQMWREYLKAKEQYENLPSDAKKTAEPPKNTRLRIEDTTIEGAQEVLLDSPNGVLMLRDELSGWFGSIDKYAGHRGAANDRGFWLQSFNGGSYPVSRIKRGHSMIENLSVSVLGGIQPEPMRKLAADAIDDGLLQRLLPIVLRPGTATKDEPTSQAAQRYEAAVERLQKMARPFDDLHFDEATRALRQRLEAKHLELMGCESFNKKLGAHIGKYDGLFVRLCVMWHCIEDDSGEGGLVSEQTANRVASFLHQFLLPHAIAFYAGVLGLSDDHDRLTAVAGYILAHKLERITNRDIQRGDRTMRNLKREDSESIFHQLEALGWVEKIPGRRLSDPPRWLVNEEVHTLFAERAAREGERRERERSMIAGLLGGRGE